MYLWQSKLYIVVLWKNGTVFVAFQRKKKFRRRKTTIKVIRNSNSENSIWIQCLWSVHLQPSEKRQRQMNINSMGKMCWCIKCQLLWTEMDLRIQLNQTKPNQTECASTKMDEIRNFSLETTHSVQRQEKLEIRNFGRYTFGSVVGHLPDENEINQGINYTVLNVLLHSLLVCEMNLFVWFCWVLLALKLVDELGWERLTTMSVECWNIALQTQTKIRCIHRMNQPFCFIIGILLDLFECVRIVRAKRIVSSFIFSSKNEKKTDENTNTAQTVAWKNW